VLRVDQYYAKRGGGNDGHGDWSFDIPRPTYAAWVGDTWAVNNRLTLNLGVRYDLAPRDLDPPLVRETDILVDNGRSTENVGFRNGIRDLDNVAPRIGFAWNATGDNRLVIRGGTGLFYTVMGSAHVIDMQLWNGQRVIVNSYPNDKQPGFLQNPSRGVTADDILAGRVPLAPQNVTVVSEQMRMPYTWQSVLGFQKQVNDVMAFDADLTYWRGYDEESNVPKYDFNWQINYELATPLKLPAGSKITAVGHYDNSPKNRYNPAPEKEVYWSDQSWDEMFIPYIEYTIDSQTLGAAPKPTSPTQRPRP